MHTLFFMAFCKKFRTIFSYFWDFGKILDTQNTDLIDIQLEHAGLGNIAGLAHATPWCCVRPVHVHVTILGRN